MPPAQVTCYLGEGGVPAGTTPNARSLGPCAQNFNTDSIHNTAKSYTDESPYLSANGGSPGAPPAGDSINSSKNLSSKSYTTAICSSNFTPAAECSSHACNIGTGSRTSGHNVLRDDRRAPCPRFDDAANLIGNAHNPINGRAAGQR